MNEELDYFKDLEFDDNELDKAFNEQHILNMKYYELYANKIEEVNEQKRIVKVKESEMKEVYSKVYLKYASERDEKGKAFTLPILNAKAEIDEKYYKKKVEYFSAIKKQNQIQKQCDILEGVVKSFQQRKNALEAKRDLFIFGWYGEVRQKNNKEKIINNIHERLSKRRNEND